MPLNKAVLGMTLGLIIGAVLGYYLWFSYGDITYWVLCMCAGVSIGLILGYGQQDWEASKMET